MTMTHDTKWHHPVTHALLGEHLPVLDALASATGAKLSQVVQAALREYLAGRGADPAVVAAAVANAQGEAQPAAGGEVPAGVVFHRGVPAQPRVEVRYDGSRYRVAVVDEAGVVRGVAQRTHRRRDTAARAVAELAKRTGWACRDTEPAGMWP